jgi:hypothetical protein
MPRWSKPLFLVLALTIAVSSWAEPMPASVRPSRPAGCHQHSRQSPVPAQQGYRCCVAGHQQAMLPDFSNNLPTLVPVRVAHEREYFPAASPLQLFFGPIRTTEGPPGASNLRI